MDTPSSSGGGLTSTGSDVIVLKNFTSAALPMALDETQIDISVGLMIIVLVAALIPTIWRKRSRTPTLGSPPTCGGGCCWLGGAARAKRWILFSVEGLTNTWGGVLVELMSLSYRPFHAVTVDVQSQ